MDVVNDDGSGMYRNIRFQYVSIRFNRARFIKLNLFSLASFTPFNKFH